MLGTEFSTVYKMQEQSFLVPVWRLSNKYQTIFIAGNHWDKYFLFPVTQILYVQKRFNRKWRGKDRVLNNRVSIKKKSTNKTNNVYVYKWKYNTSSCIIRYKLDYNWSQSILLIPAPIMDFLFTSGINQFKWILYQFSSVLLSKMFMDSSISN